MHLKQKLSPPPPQKIIFDNYFISIKHLNILTHNVRVSAKLIFYPIILSQRCLTLNCRRSQIFIRPSSPPDAMNGSFRFQWMTLMSRSWASLAVIIQALEGAARASHTRIVLSTEQEANT